MRVIHAVEYAGSTAMAFGVATSMWFGINAAYEEEHRTNEIEAMQETMPLDLSLGLLSKEEAYERALEQIEIFKHSRDEHFMRREDIIREDMDSSFFGAAIAICGAATQITVRQAQRRALDKRAISGAPAS